MNLASSCPREFISCQFHCGLCPWQINGCISISLTRNSLLQDTLKMFKKAAWRPLFLKYDCHYPSNEPSLVSYVAFMRQKGHRVCACLRGQVSTVQVSKGTHDFASVSLSIYCATQLVSLENIFISGFKTQNKTSLLCQYLLTALDVSVVGLALINLHLMTSSLAYHCTSLAINSRLFWLKQENCILNFLKFSKSN